MSGAHQSMNACVTPLPRSLMYSSGSFFSLSITRCTSTSSVCTRYCAPGSRIRATILPVSPATAARTASSPTSTASALSTGLTSAIDARPMRPGFSLLAL